MTSIPLIPILSALLVLLIGVTFLYFYFYNLREELKNSWLIINQKTRLRLDKLPLLIEITRRALKFAPGFANAAAVEKILQEITVDHDKIWPISELSSQKVQQELALSSKLHELWKLLFEESMNDQSTASSAQNVASGRVEVSQNSTIKNNVNLIAMRKEIVDLGQEIDQLGETYNQKIYRYNHKIRFIFWRPLTMIFGFKRVSIFEFEA